MITKEQEIALVEINRAALELNKRIFNWTVEISRQFMEPEALTGVEADYIKDILKAKDITAEEVINWFFQDMGEID